MSVVVMLSCLSVRAIWAFAVMALVAPLQVAANPSGVVIEPRISGLDAPWGVGFLPDGSVIITERDGTLLHFDGQGRRQSVKGVPQVYARGQGGLLDVVVARDFAQTREVFFTYAKPIRGGAKTALAVARLSKDATRLTDWRVIYEMPQASGGGRHFGSRVVEARDGTLYLTVGDRGDRDLAQDTGTANGAVIRVNRDGSFPDSNPDFGAGAVPGLWSIGHRNPQGAAMDAQARIWVVEHGPRGGDEINLLKQGANFGWPVIGYGTHYSGAKVGEGTKKSGLEQPALYWDPSIAPSGMMIYGGDLFPDWRGDIFVGSLKFDYISHMRDVGGVLQEIDQIRAPETERVRDIRQAPDGSIWFLSVGQGAAYRIAPSTP